MGSVHARSKYTYTLKTEHIIQKPHEKQPCLPHWLSRSGSWQSSGAQAIVKVNGRNQRPLIPHEISKDSKSTVDKQKVLKVKGIPMKILRLMAKLTLGMGKKS